MKLPIRIGVAMTAALILTGCFTGVESTPKITAGELKRRHVTTTPEQQFLQGVVADPPASWQAGKAFYITDSKIQLIFTRPENLSDSLAGATMNFVRFDTIAAINSNSAIEVVLTVGSDTLRYRPGIDVEALRTRQRLEIPFTVEQSIVDTVRSLMAGNRYWITSMRWLDPATLQPTEGSRRYLPVEVVDVQPGTAAQPLKVVFRPLEGDYQRDYALLMTVGDDRLAIRNFDSLFSFSDPRRRYSLITDQVWDVITRGRVAPGMTRQECRLSLGAPNLITHGSGTHATIERWSYADGVYLIFDDGLLTDFRL